MQRIHALPQIGPCQIDLGAIHGVDRYAQASLVALLTETAGDGAKDVRIVRKPRVRLNPIAYCTVTPIHKICEDKQVSVCIAASSHDNNVANHLF